MEVKIGWVVLSFVGLWAGHPPMLRKRERTTTPTNQADPPFLQSIINETNYEMKTKELFLLVEWNN